MSRKKITGEDVDKKGILASHLGHWELVTHTMRTLRSFLKKLKIELCMIQTSCLLVYIQINHGCKSHMGTSLHCGPIYNSHNRQAAQYPWLDSFWRHIMYIKGILFSHKNNEIMTFAAL